RIRGNYLNGTQQLAVDAQANNNRSRSSGVNDRKSIKGNYREKINKTLESYGSYRFEFNDNDSRVNRSKETFFPDYVRREDTETNELSSGKSHRFSWNFEYRPDTNNYLKIEPDISFQRN